MSKTLGAAARRRKGHDSERWVARQLREIEPSVKRGLQSRGGTAEEPDVHFPGLHIECKCQKRPDAWAALKQAAEAAAGTDVPVAICKRSGTEPVVTMHFADWVAMLRKSRGK